MKCKELCKINFKDYKIILNNCPNGHCFSNLLLNEISNFEVINEKEIKYNNCKKSKSDSFGFYYCCNCKTNFCPLCKKKHDQQHFIIKYESKEFLCKDHGQRYILYCKELKKNLCDICENHKNKYKFNYSFLYTIKNKNKDSNNNINKLRIKIDELKGEINNITNEDNIIKINDIIDNLEKYFKFINNLINGCYSKYKNYNSLINANSIDNYNEIIIKDISNIINEKKENKYNFINEIYNKMLINNEIIL